MDPAGVPKPVSLQRSEGRAQVHVVVDLRLLRRFSHIRAQEGVEHFGNVNSPRAEISFDCLKPLRSIWTAASMLDQVLQHEQLLRTQVARHRSRASVGKYGTRPPPSQDPSAECANDDWLQVTPHPQSHGAPTRIALLPPNLLHGASQSAAGGWWFIPASPGI